MDFFPYFGHKCPPDHISSHGIVRHRMASYDIVCHNGQNGIFVRNMDKSSLLDIFEIR